MPLTPYAKVLMSINGGGTVSGAQTIAGAATVQLSGENTAGWQNPLWEIYEYPLGFAVPAGWTSVNGVYRASATTPPSFTVLPQTVTKWGKYLFRLTILGGVLNGVFHGSSDAQPLVDDTSGVQVPGLNGEVDVCFGEAAQFDAQREYIGQLKQTIRSGFVELTTPSNSPTRIRRYPVANGDYRAIRVLLKVQSSDGSGGVLGEWEVKGGYKRVSGTLAQAYAPTITAVYTTGSPGTPTITLNGNTDVDLNVTGVAATNLDWALTESVL